MNSVVKVYLVDDHAVVREGYKHLLEKANIKVIAEAMSGEEAYLDYTKVQPDVVIMDLSMPGMGGIETIKKLITKDKNAKILAFSMHDDIVFCSRAMQAGAVGYADLDGVAIVPLIDRDVALALEADVDHDFIAADTADAAGQNGLGLVVGDSLVDRTGDGLSFE